MDTGIKRSLYWTITEACQLKCRYCFYETGINERNKNHVKISDYKDKVGEIAQSFDKVIFTGGEVLLHPEFWGLVSLVRSNDMDVGFLTNGIDLNNENVDKAMDLGVKEISISLDSLEGEVNDSTRIPIKENFDATKTIIKNIEYLAKSRDENGGHPSLTILQSIYPENINHVDKMTQFAKKYGAKLLVHPVGVQKGIEQIKDLRLEEMTREQKGELSKSLNKWAKGNTNFKDYAEIAMSFINGSKPSQVYCPNGLENYVLDIKGNLRSCFSEGGYTFGNIFDTSVKELVEIERPEYIKNAECSTLACSCMIEKKRNS